MGRDVKDKITSFLQQTQPIVINHRVSRMGVERTQEKQK